MPAPDDDNPSPRAGVQSLHRALDLLEVVAARGGALSIGEIAERTGIPLPTTHRLLRTLIDRGYVRQSSDRRYALGFRLVPLAASASAMAGAGAERLLRGLVDALGETANLTVLDGDRVTYVAQVPGRHSMRMFTEVGRRVHLHCTAVGKALLAETSDEHVRALLGPGPLPRYTPHTVTAVDDLVEQLALVRDRGFAVDEGEQEVGVRCVAVAVPGFALRRALSISAPAPRLSDDVLEQAVPALRRTAEDLARLGSPRVFTP